MAILIKYLAILLFIIFVFSTYNIRDIIFITIEATIIYFILYFIIMVLTHRCEHKH